MYATLRWFAPYERKSSVMGIIRSQANPYTSTPFRVGKRYSDEWHKAHLYNPRNVVPESNMPAFPWLFDAELDGKSTAKKMEMLKLVGVPYTEEDISGAAEAVKGVKEVDALVAYMQQLGTLLTYKR